jgi:hypothetical protein
MSNVRPGHGLTGATKVLNEGDSGWKTLNGAPKPFVFFLDTNQGNHCFSDTSLNTDGHDHMLAFQKNDGSNKFLLFWDDQFGGGDRDFNDFVIKVIKVLIKELRIKN